MEADWQRFYGRDLRADLFGPEPMGARRLRALINGLPPDAMLWRQQPAWGIDQELAALGIEVAHSHLRVTHAASSKKGSSQPKALRIPRPTDSAKQRPRRRRPVSEAQLARYGGSVVRVATGGDG